MEAKELSESLLNFVSAAYSDSRTYLEETEKMIQIAKRREAGERVPKEEQAAVAEKMKLLLRSMESAAKAKGETAITEKIKLLLRSIESEAKAKR